MKLKHIIYGMITGTMCYAATSCDTIDKADRLIYVKPAEVKRCVLLEDFTGQRCVNCPDATNEINKLQEQYGEDNVIAVAIHGGYFGIYSSTPTVTALGTEEAREYYDRWNIEAQPAGMVNRRGGITNYTAWATDIYNELQKPSPVSITLNTTFDSTDRSLQVTTSILSGEKLNGKLQLWLTEDSITALQLMPDGSPDPAYRHNHVFRKSVNGTWGTDITLGESQAEATFTTTVDSEWQPANMHIVAFVYNQEGVLQVTKQKIIY